MDQRKVIDLVEQFRVERGQAVLEKLTGLILSGCQDPEVLRNTGLSAMYWFVNVVADAQKEEVITVLIDSGYPEAGELVRGST